MTRQLAVSTLEFIFAQLTVRPVFHLVLFPNSSPAGGTWDLPLGWLLIVDKVTNLFGSCDIASDFSPGRHQRTESETVFSRENL